MERYAGEFGVEAAALPLEKLMGTLLDFGSPLAIALEFIKMMTGWDPIGDFVKWMAGDWPSFQECADAWGALANLSEAVAVNVKAGNVELTGHGRGTRLILRTFNLVSYSSLWVAIRSWRAHQTRRLYQSLGGMIGSLMMTGGIYYLLAGH